MDSAQKGFSRLVAYMDRYPDAAVAFSGGTVSALLVCALYEAQGKGAFVLTANTPFFTQEELYRVHEVLDDYPKMRGERIAIPALMDIPQLTEASGDIRCEACAVRVSERLSQVAKSIGASVLFDGKVADAKDATCRLLKQVMPEVQVISPCVELGFTRQDVKNMLKAIGRAYYIWPANDCLARRFLKDMPVTVTGLDYVEAAEKYIRRYTRRGLRVYLDGKKAVVCSEETLDVQAREDVMCQLLNDGRAGVSDVIFYDGNHWRKANR